MVHVPFSKFGSGDARGAVAKKDEGFNNGDSLIHHHRYRKYNDARSRIRHAVHGSIERRVGGAMRSRESVWQVVIDEKDTKLCILVCHCGAVLNPLDILIHTLANKLDACNGRH